MPMSIPQAAQRRQTKTLHIWKMRNVSSLTVLTPVGSKAVQLPTANFVFQPKHRRSVLRQFPREAVGVSGHRVAAFAQIVHCTPHFTQRRPKLEGQDPAKGPCDSRRRQRSWHHCQQLGDLLRVAGGVGSDALAEAVDGRAKAMQLDVVDSRIVDVGWLSRNRSWIRHEGWLSRG